MEFKYFKQSRREEVRDLTFYEVTKVDKGGEYKMYILAKDGEVAMRLAFKLGFLEIGSRTKEYHFGVKASPLTFDIIIPKSLDGKIIKLDD